MPWLTRKENICTDPEKGKIAKQVYSQNWRNQNNICPRSCLFTNIFLERDSGREFPGLDNLGQAKIIFRKYIKHTREYYLYSLLSLLAEIGGYVGLLMGVSIFNITKANDIFIDWYSKTQED